MQVSRNTRSPLSGSAPAFRRPLRAAVLLALAVAFAAGASHASGPDKSLIGSRIRPLDTTAISNGTGDAHASVTVDPYGSFGSNSAAGDLLFDPVGATAQAGTTFYSAVWFSGPGNAGNGGNGTFLDEFALPVIAFDTLEATRAVSHFTVSGVRFDLVQEMLPASATGSTLRQTYTITNQTGGPTSFDLIRHMDGDLRFDTSLIDGGGVSASGQQLFEFDASDDPANPTTFLGIDLNGNANLGFRIAEFNMTDDIDASGRAILDGTITADGPGGNNTVNADTNNNRLTDFPFDVTLSLGQTLTLANGATATFVTNTVLGEGSPGQVLAPANIDLSGPTNGTVGSAACFNATVTDQNGDPFAGQSVLFDIAGTTGNDQTVARTSSAAGTANFCFTPAGAGTDTVTACVDLNGNGECDPDEPSDVITFTATAPSPGGCSGKLRVSRPLLDFGSVRVGSTRRKTLVVQNISRTEPLTVGIGEATGPFSVILQRHNRTLPPRGSVVFFIEFAPDETGEATGELEITSSDCTRPLAVVDLVGVGKNRRRGGKK